jgi:hypothetical protein
VAVKRSPGLAVLVEMAEVVQTESAVPELIVCTRGGGGGGGLLAADAGGFPPDEPAPTPAWPGFEEPFLAAPPELAPDPAPELAEGAVPPPATGLADKATDESGLGDATGVGVGLVVAMLFDDVESLQADCAINSRAPNTTSKSVIPNRVFIKPLPG